LIIVSEADRNGGEDNNKTGGHYMKTRFKGILALFCLISLLIPSAAFANGAEMLFMVASKKPVAGGTNIGDPMGGGFLAGYFSLAGESAFKWDTNATGVVTGKNSYADGFTNSSGLFLLGSRYAAATFCRGLNIGGYTDWFLPSRYELEVAYYNLKGGTVANNTGGGLNPNAVLPEPINTAYTAINPAQTTVAAFMTGGSQAFATVAVWSSTERNATQAWAISFSNGQPLNFPKTDGGTYARCFRRIAL